LEPGKATQRKDWYAEMGFKGLLNQNVPLAKQKIQILDICRSMQLYKIEKAILNVVDFPSVLGKCKVELTESLSYQATFDNEEEKIVKEFPTLKKGNDWLVSMTCAYKRGTLNACMRKTETDVRAAASLEKTRDALLQADSSSSLTETLKTLSPSHPEAKTDQAVDVTMDILRPPKTYTCQMSSSDSHVHRGSLQSFVKLGATEPKACGILLGKTGWNGKFHVTTMVLSTGELEELLKHEAILDYCSQQKLHMCGFLCVGRYDMWRERVVGLFAELVHTSPLFIGVQYEETLSGRYYAMEMDAMREDKPFKRVNLTWATNPRDAGRKFIYNICWENELGASIIAKATERICKAVVETVEAGVLKPQSSKALPPTTTKFKRSVIPADGMCPWHALIAAEDLTTYLAVPRKASGYPKAHLMVQEEEKRAKELHKSICDQALNRCHHSHRPSIQRVMAEGQMCPSDLEWVAEMAGVNVRVTCCEQARGGKA